MGDLDSIPIKERAWTLVVILPFCEIQGSTSIKAIRKLLADDPLKLAFGKSSTNKSELENDTLFGIIWESRANSDKGTMDNML